MSPNTQAGKGNVGKDKFPGGQPLSGNRMPEEESTAQDAVSLLKADHEKVTELFSQFESAEDDDEKVELANTICTELKIHTLIEEEIFYPAAREALDKDDLLDEASVEHDSAKELIAQIEEGSPDDDKWEAKVRVLGEYIKHHVNEEQSELFSAVEASDMDLDELGQEMADRKQELAGEFADDSNDIYDEEDEEDDR